MGGQKKTKLEETDVRQVKERVTAEGKLEQRRRESEK